MYEQFLQRALIGLAPGLLVAGAGCDHGAGAPGHDAAEVAMSLPVQQPVAGRWPAAAFDGTQYLVAWEDLRAGRPILYGARVGAAGETLDPFGFPILDAFLDDTVCCEYEPVVATDGSDFLIVTEVAGQILGVRVSRAGDVLDPDGIVIATVPSYASRPALVFDGQQYMVAWAQRSFQDSPDAGVYWARVQPDGTVLDPGGVRGHALASAAVPVGLSFDGTNYLLTWVDKDAALEAQAVYAARIARDGKPVDADALAISPSGVWLDSIGLAASFDGSNHVVVWKGVFGDDPYYGSPIMATRVTSERTVLDPGGIQVDLWGQGYSTLHRVAIAAVDGHSVVTLSMHANPDYEPGYQPIAVMVLGADGEVATHLAYGHASGLQATLVAHPDGALLLWRDGTAVAADHAVIMGARLDKSGWPMARGAVTLGFTASGQRVRAVASDGQTSFVVWADTRVPDAEGLALFGARIAADGTPLDAEGIPLTAEAAEQIHVVFDGANFVVIWSAGEDAGIVRAVRVSPEGELLDTEPLFPVDWLVTDLAAASDGTHTLLIGHFATDRRLAAVLVDQSGAVASAVVRPGSDLPDSRPRSSAVSFDGTGYLVVWHDDTALLGHLVGADGALVGQSFPIASEHQEPHCTRVASGGGNHLVVWQDADGNVMAKRVSPSGEVLDPAGRLITAGAEAAPSHTTCPAVVFDGERFVVAWRAPSAFDGGLLDLYGAEVSPDGEVLRQFAISETPESEGLPFLAAGEEGQVVAAYDRFVPGAPYDSQRAQGRFLWPESGTQIGGGGCQAGASEPAPVALLWLLGSAAVLYLVRRRRAR